MFKKILIANRGEIAVRVIRACRNMGIKSVAVYDMADEGSLHVRLADECVRLNSSLGYVDQEELIRHARATGAEAIHPGYGFLAENPSFIHACEQAGLTFIGPPADLVEHVKDKIATLQQVEAAGFATVRHSTDSFGEGDIEALRAATAQVGYPLVIKSCSGGRGRGTRMVRSPERLEETVRQAQAGSAAVFRDSRVYLEQAILPSRYVEVQLLGDRRGALIHLGERDSSIQRNNQKLITESPAPYLSVEQHEHLWSTALQIARLLGCSSACTIEFVVDSDCQLYFTEIKPRIQVEHPVTELVTGVDIVQEQIRLAAGEPLSITQADVRLHGTAMQCRIKAEDPWNNFLPSPGTISLFRQPGGPNVRVDTYVYSGCEIPLRYDPTFAKLAVWGEDREECLNRMRGALEECFVTGVQTNLSLLQRVFGDPDFAQGVYTTEFSRRPLLSARAPEAELRDLAAIVAISHALRTTAARPSLPERLLSGWHQSSRRLPN
ncbi:MAG: ATP-grasp domain-containing protein [Kouleothrix sp.]|nr:ATP-grasp domain-containing protein [Kouleothrix sp.]